MEHEVIAEHDATIADVRVAVGDAVAEGQPLAVLTPGDDHGHATDTQEARPSTGNATTGTRPRRPPGSPRRPRRQSATATTLGLDAARPDAVAKRHDQGRRTARENLADLLDPDSFVEYGPLMFAAQERRRDKQELIERTPADGLVGGVGAIAGESLRGDVLRLHGAGGNAGDAQPPEEGPPVRDRRAPPAAGRAVRRGRRRAPGRCRHADRGGPGLSAPFSLSLS